MGLIRINRPEVLNALNNEVVDGITRALDAFEADENIACIVLTGKAKAMDMCLTGRMMDAQEAEGLLFERRTFQASFSLEDQKVGMAAFIAKRKPEFKHR